jgi:hypothetical protein
MNLIHGADYLIAICFGMLLHAYRAQLRAALPKTMRALVPVSTAGFLFLFVLAR